MICENIFKTNSHPNHKSKGPEVWTQCSSPPVCHVTHVICHVSHVSCHVSGVICQVSHVTSNSQTVRARELKFWEKVHLLHPLSPVTCHMSHVKCQTLHVTCQMSHVIFFKRWRYLVEGLFLMGPTPSSSYNTFNESLMNTMNVLTQPAHSDCKNQLTP